jgi:REP element-mobilizing transposase RayT
MPNYRRAFVPGGCFFFTVSLLERRRTLLVDHIAILREAVATSRQNHPFTIDAFVVLPDHLHTVWTLPPGDGDFRLAGVSSRAILPERCQNWNVLVPFALRAASVASGSAGSGSI